MLRDAISFAEDRGVTSFGAYISGWDEKAGVLEREGFERVVPDAFDINLGDTTQPVGYWRLG